MSRDIAMAERVRALVDAAPPLTAEQCERLAALLPNPARPIAARRKNKAASAA